MRISQELWTIACGRLRQKMIIEKGHQVLLSVIVDGSISRHQQVSKKLKTVLDSCSNPRQKKNFTVAAIGHFVPFIRLGSPAWLDRTMVSISTTIIIMKLITTSYNTTTPIIQGGMEPQIVQTFAAKFDLNLIWFDAKFSWGKFVEATQRYHSHQDLSQGCKVVDSCEKLQ